MPITDQLLSIPLGAAGISGKDDPLQSQKPSVMQNIIINKTGRADRRWGYAPLGNTLIGSANTITSCAAIESFNQELLLFDGAQAYSYLKANNAWAKRGSAISVIQTNNQIIKNTSQQLSADFGTLNGVSLYAWEDSRGGIRYNILDETTGTVILFDQPLYTNMPSSILRPKVVASASLNQLLVFFTNTNGQLYFVAVNPANPGQVNTFANVILNTLHTPYFFDVAVNGTNVYVPYYTSTGVSLTAFSTATGSLQTNWTVAVASLTQTPTGCLNVCTDSSQNAWVSYVDGYVPDVANTAIYNSSGSAVLAPTQTINQATGSLQSLAGIVNGSTLTLYAEAQGTQTYNNIVYQNTLTLAGTAGSTSIFKRSVGLASKPFAYNGTTYVNLAYQSNLQPTYFTYDQNGNQVSKVNQGLGGGVISNSDYMLPECPAISTGIFRYSNLVKGEVNTEAGIVLSLLGVNSTKLNFFNSNQFLSASLNDSLYTVGGVLSSYDGTTYLEHNFNLYPENITNTTSSSGGNLGTGTYQYCILYAYDDNNVHTQYSTPSTPLSVTFVGGSTNQVTLTIPTIRLTAKSKIRVEVYRTVANGTILYRVSSVAAPLYNDPTVDTVQFTDTLADASITGNGEMYTQPLATTGGNPILENIAPPACSLIATYADRIFLSGVDDPYTIWYSKQSSASRPAEFSDTLLLRVDPDGGAITGLVRYFDKLIIFKKYAIFYIAGLGPTDTGDQNDFGDPIQIPSGGIGCANPNSIMATSFGLFFASPNGIFMLDTSGNVTYKGAPVENFNSLTINSANLITNQWMVFTTNQGTSLVYDYFYDQWTTWTNQTSVDSDLYPGNNNLHLYAQANGVVMQQTPGVFSDNGSAIPINITTHWINPTVLQGYQLVVEAYILGSYKGTHTLNVAVGFDNQESFSNYAAIPVDSTLGLAKYGQTSPYGSDLYFGGAQGNGQPLYMFRIDIVQKCTSVRFQITDSQVGITPNEGANWSALLLVIRRLVGGNKLPAIKQFAAL